MKSTKNGLKTSNAPIVETGTKVEIVEETKPVESLQSSTEKSAEIEELISEIPVIEDMTIEGKQSVLEIISDFTSKLMKLLFGE